MLSLRRLLHVLLAAWSLILFPASAQAEGGDLLCAADGSVRSGSFWNTTAGASGTACQYSGLEHIFGQVVCSFTSIVNSVIGKVYCSIQVALLDTVQILLTVYVAVFGVQILMGMTQLSSKEIMTRLLKIAGVWMFVSQSGYMIGYVFNFFVDLGASGIFWALGSIPIGNTGSTCMSTINTAGLQSVMPVYAYLDKMIYCAVLAPISSANVGILGFFLAMSIIVPPVFMMGLYWLWSILSVLVRAAISFLMSISALAFLIALSPIFLSLMLFQVTYQFFENWLRYLISFSIQMIVVFACIGLWLTTVPLIVGFFTELSGIVFNSDRSTTTATATNLSKGWGICPYKFAPNTYVPSVRCDKAGFNPDTSTTSAGYLAARQQSIDANDPAILQNYIKDRQKDKESVIPLSKLSASENDPLNGCTNPVSCPSGTNFVGGNKSLGDLLYYVFYHLISLIIISYAFDALLRIAPEIASALAGPEYIFNVGQGFGAGGFGTTGKGSLQRLKQRKEGGSGNALVDTYRSLGLGSNPTEQFAKSAGSMVGGRSSP